MSDNLCYSTTERWEKFLKVVEMKKDTRITIRIEKELFDKLQNQAKKEDSSISTIIRKILKEYILEKWS